MSPITVSCKVLVSCQKAGTAIGMVHLIRVWGSPGFGQWSLSFPFFYKKIFYLFIFREGEGREKERERNINVWLPLKCPLLETWPVIQAHAPTGN